MPSLDIFSYQVLTTNHLLCPLGIIGFTNKHDISFIFRRDERNATSTHSIPSLYEIEVPRTKVKGLHVHTQVYIL
jgi:hypothetical protein